MYRLLLTMILKFVCTMQIVALGVDNISYNYPNIPLLEIYTENSVEPSCRKLETPPGCWGESITDNDYVNGNLKLWIDHQEAYSSGEFDSGVYGMKLKIRGNSSGVNLEQHPYKIKLFSKADLFFSGDTLQENKEWVLLSIAVWNKRYKSKYTDVTPFIGACVSQVLGTEWTPRYQFVNLVMNGTYRGCYVLADAIGRSDGRINTKKSGFIIENDAYWWKPNEEYFQTRLGDWSMGYTFKYPKDENITDSVKTLYCDYMSQIENMIYDDNLEADLYIDNESFARWLLVHDILGTVDAAGSNMFLFKRSMSQDSPFESRLRMGPSWDYDTIFRADDKDFSTIHNSDLFYYKQLIKKTSFFTEYSRLWTEYKDTLYEEVANCLNCICANGEEIDKSLKASYQLYGQNYTPISEQCEESLMLLYNRMLSLNEIMYNLFNESKIEPVYANMDSSCHDLMGCRVNRMKKNGLYVYNNKIVLFR